MRNDWCGRWIDLLDFCISISILIRKYTKNKINCKWIKSVLSFPLYWIPLLSLINAFMMRSYSSPVVDSIPKQRGGIHKIKDKKIYIKHRILQFQSNITLYLEYKLALFTNTSLYTGCMCSSTWSTFIFSFGYTINHCKGWFFGIR